MSKETKSLLIILVTIAVNILAPILMRDMYKDYTILKYDTLDKNKDLVFGFSGQIINKLNAAY